MGERKWKSGELDVQKTEFDGTVVKAEWTKGKVFEGSKKTEAPDQLAIELHPTSYEGEKRLAWYNYSDVGLMRGDRQSKWMKLLTGLEKCGVDISKDPHEQILIGKNFHWIEDVEEFEIDGEKKQSRTLIPTKFNGAGALPEKSAQESKGQPAGESDLDQLILTFAGDGIDINALYKELEGKGHKKVDVLARVKKLEKAGKVLFDEGKVISA